MHNGLAFMKKKRQYAKVHVRKLGPPSEHVINIGVDQRPYYD